MLGGGAKKYKFCRKKYKFCRKKCYFSGKSAIFGSKSTKITLESCVNDVLTYWMDIRGRGAGRYKFCWKNCHFAGKIVILPEKLPFCQKNCHFARKSAISGLVQVQMVSSVCHMLSFPTCFRRHLKKSFLCYFKPQKPLEMTIKAHSAVLNVHFYHHLHLPTSFLGYRTQFELIKFNLVLIVPNSLKNAILSPRNL